MVNHHLFRTVSSCLAIILLWLGFGATAFAAPTISADKEYYLPQEEVTLRYQDFSSRAQNDFICLYWLEEDPVTSSDCQRLYGMPESGEFRLKVPYRTGRYQFRFKNPDLPQGSPDVVSRIFRVQLHPDGPFSLKLSETSLPPRGEFTVHLTPAGGYAIQSWVGITHAGEPHDAPGKIRTLGSQYLRYSPEGVYKFFAPSEAGQYVVRLVAYAYDSTEAVELAAASFEVYPPTGGSIALQRDRFEPGERIRVAVTPPKYGKESAGWVNIYELLPPNEEGDGFVNHKEVPATEGILDFSAPNHFGRFEVRLYRSAKGKPAQIIPFTVVPPGESGAMETLEARYAGERILNYHSDVEVHPDGEMTVTETIRVWSEHYNIKHGIYRDFPTRYGWLQSLPQVRGFKVLSVKRDSQIEPWFTKNLDNGVRIYIGSKEALVTQGEHVYELTYHTDGQVGFFGEHDELYWNITGNGWEFPISQASATIRLPGTPEILRHTAYTGYSGEQGANFTFALDAQGNANFVTNRPLEPRQGLTVVTAWAKGVVAPPTFAQQAYYLLRNLKPLLVTLLSLLVVLVYYLVAWRRVGRDPEKGPVVVQYEPPAGYSPAALRFVRERGYDKTALTATILQLAVKGYLRIVERKKKHFQLEIAEREPGADLAPEEAKSFKPFEPGQILELGEYSVSVKLAGDWLKQELKTRLEKHYFLKNLLYMIPGLVLSIAAIGVSYWQFFFLGGEPFGLSAAVIWMTPFTVFLGNMVWASWHGVFIWKGFKDFLSSLIFSCAITPFFILIAAAQISFAYYVFISWWFEGFFILVLVLVNVLFYFLLRRVTPAGRKLLDQTEGFRWFLKATEEDRLNFLHPPERTPELFERYLPFAVALDCENAWAKQFEAVLEGAMISANDGSRSLGNWYRTDHAFGSGAIAGSLASSLGSSFSGSISSSSTAPGSSSGFSGGSSGGGGGGSSGGGGGGGGGGGW